MVLISSGNEKRVDLQALDKPQESPGRTRDGLFSANLRIGTIAAIVHICIVPTIIGFWCWNKAVQTLGASGAMVFYNTLPLYGVLLGAILLNEQVGQPQIISGGLIIAGGLMGTLGGWNRGKRPG